MAKKDPSFTEAWSKEIDYKLILLKYMAPLYLCIIFAAIIIDGFPKIENFIPVPYIFIISVVIGILLSVLNYRRLRKK